MRRVALAHDYLVCLRQLRAQQLHDVGDLAGVEFGEQRHARDHAPGHNEIAAVDLLREGGGDDADRKRHHDQAEEDGAGGDQLAECGHRHHVAVADGAKGDDRPPQRVGNGAELVRLHFALGQMHQGGGDQRGAERDHQAAEQRAALAIEHIEQRAQRRRIARDLEEAHHAEHQHEAQIRWQQHREPERQHGDEIDDAGGAERIFEPRARAGKMLVWPMLDRAPQPQAIFDREDDERKILDQSEDELIARADLRHRFERDRDQITQDQNDQQPVDHAAETVARRTLIEDQIDAPAQFLDLVACHGAGTLLVSRTLLIQYALAAVITLDQAPVSAVSTALSAASALEPSGPPAWAMSGRPPPPLPPRASAPLRTSSTALKRLVSSSVTATTMPALPSALRPTMATTPEPTCFLPSSARLRKSLSSMPETARAKSFTSPTLRISEASPAALPPPPMASFFRASESSRSSFRRSSSSAAMRAGISSSGALSSAAASLTT